MAAIDVGSAAIVRGGQTSATRTYLCYDNPANADGSITSVEMWAASNMTGVKVGTFSGTPDTWTSRDVETIGDVTAGSKQTFSGLDCDVLTDDIIGIYHATGQLERAPSGYIQAPYKDGDQFGQGAQTYSGGASDTISLYGIGVTTGVTHEGAATLTGVGTLAGIGHGIFIGKSTLSGAGTLAGIGRLTAIGKATLSGLGTLTANGVITVVGKVALAGTGTLSGIGRLIAIGKAILSGVGTLTVKTVRIGKVLRYRTTFEASHKYEAKMKASHKYTAKMEAK